MTDLRTHLTEQINALTQERNALPQQFDTIKAQFDAKVAEVERDAAGRVKTLQDEMENLRKKVQSRADFLAGQVAALKDLLDRFPTQPVVAAPRPAAPPKPVVAKRSPPPPLPVEEPAYEEDEEEGYGEDEEDGEDEFDNGTASAESDPEEGDDDLASAIENASDEEAVRALLARYNRKA